MCGLLASPGRTPRRICDAKTSVRRRDYERGPGAWSPSGKCRSRAGPAGGARRDHRAAKLGLEAFDFAGSTARLAVFRATYAEKDGGAAVGRIS